ncbi:hypothetical protein [Hoeflea sp.]|uniref:hypothetical protein n=1 Tax=Hoeflea sp. TaxID=1940281 RepID=UPI0019A1B2C9|nr:hypothetical protein [Hoeflea sp.]MBC7286132.1 hypothetical protein [Hoeflea sp.]
MLDLIEALGFDLDALDSGQSLRLHSVIRPRAKPQSLCSAVIEAELWTVAGAIGFWHCLRSWERYHR